LNRQRIGYKLECGGTVLYEEVRKVGNNYECFVTTYRVFIGRPGEIDSDVDCVIYTTRIVYNCPSYHLKEQRGEVIRPSIESFTETVMIADRNDADVIRWSISAFDEFYNDMVLFHKADSDL